MDKNILSPFLETIATVALGIIAVALVATIVSKNAQTPAVIQAAGSAFGSGLATATGPVTGNTTAPNYSYPGGSYGGMNISGSPFALQF